MIPEILKSSVKEFLDRVSQDLGNAGCNDWEWTVEQQKAVMTYMKIDVQDEDAVNSINYDYILVAIIEKALGL